MLERCQLAQELGNSEPTNVLGQSGVKGGKEYDLPSRYLPVTD